MAAAAATEAAEATVVPPEPVSFPHPPRERAAKVVREAMASLAKAVDRTMLARKTAEVEAVATAATAGMAATAVITRMDLPATVAMPARRRRAAAGNPVTGPSRQITAQMATAERAARAATAAAGELAEAIPEPVGLENQESRVRRVETRQLTNARSHTRNQSPLRTARDQPERVAKAVMAATVVRRTEKAERGKTAAAAAITAALLGKAVIKVSVDEMPTAASSPMEARDPLAPILKCSIRADVR